MSHESKEKYEYTTDFHRNALKKLNKKEAKHKALESKRSEGKVAKGVEKNSKRVDKADPLKRFKLA